MCNNFEQATRYNDSAAAAVHGIKQIEFDVTHLLFE